MRSRPTLYGSRHGVSAGHYLAAAAGFAVLEAGAGCDRWRVRGRDRLMSGHGVGGSAGVGAGAFS